MIPLDMERFAVV